MSPDVSNVYFGRAKQIERHWQSNKNTSRIMQHTDFCPYVDVDAITKFFCNIDRQHQWSSGRIHPCHRCDPGSIPGWCICSRKDLSISFNKSITKLGAHGCMYVRVCVCVCALLCASVCVRECVWEELKKQHTKKTQYNTRTKTKSGWQNPATCARVVPKPFQIWPCDIQCHNCEHVAWFRPGHRNCWKKLWMGNQRRNDIVYFQF